MLEKSTHFLFNCSTDLQDESEENDAPKKMSAHNFDMFSESAELAGASYNVSLINRPKRNVHTLNFIYVQSVMQGDACV